MANKQTDRVNQRPQDQGGARQKSTNDEDLNRKAKDKSGMQDEDIEEGDAGEAEEQ